MPSLNHVCIWSETGWISITPEEVAQIHPGGAVSARSGLFMCELCGQYVLFSKGEIQRPHFRHSSHEKSKDCPDRVGGYTSSLHYSAADHQLPLRITNVTDSYFEFELGLMRIPSGLLKSSDKIEIIPKESKRSFYYLAERLNTKGVTYFKVGPEPATLYRITVSGKRELQQFWPTDTQGVDPEGSLFDAETGKLLVYDSDIVIGKEYYLLTRRIILKPVTNNVTIKEISRRKAGYSSWVLYRISINRFDELSAKFFLDLHYRLTETPISVDVIWPVVAQSPYQIKYDAPSIMIYMKGNGHAQAFPMAKMVPYSGKYGKVIELFSQSRQQLISAGRVRALEYTYFWRDPLLSKRESVDCVVSSLSGEIIEAGSKSMLPRDGCLNIWLQYDGVVVIKRDKYIIEKIQVKAKERILVDQIQFGLVVAVFVGLDLVWESSYFREVGKSTSEVDLLSKLEKCGGPMIPLPHSAGSIASKIRNYPQIRRWLYRQIRYERVSKQAWVLLTSTIKELKK